MAQAGRRHAQGAVGALPPRGSHPQPRGYDFSSGVTTARRQAVETILRRELGGVR